MNRFVCQMMAASIALVCSCQAPGQSLATNAGLPDSPGAQTQAATPTGPHEGTAQVLGVVEDAEGNPVPEARIILSAPGKAGGRTAVSDNDGSYTFTALPGGAYRLIVTAPGFLPYTSSEFALKAGETFQVPKTPLIITTSTSVSVFATPDQIALAEVHEEEKQRVLGVFPNFYTSYVWDAQAMPAKEKYKLAFRALVDPVQFFIVAGVAGAEHFNGTYPGYGPGIEGYGKRYGAALADSTTSRIVGSALLPSILHQDPRYFYQGTGGTRSRTWHAITSTLVCRGDNGKLQPSYSHVLGSLTAGAVANAYHPESSRGLGLTFETLGVTTAANIVGNLVREFVLRGLVPSVPPNVNGKM